jgi:NAD(P)-dependent dehydrogenase (short-subunit alcohol dehydrogenase family)
MSEELATGLDGMVLIVTGAASGIGLAMARLAISRGAKVVGADVAADRLSAADPGGTWTPVVTDVSDSASAARLVDAAVAAHGRVDALFNNAGILDRLLPVDETPDDTWLRVLGVNLTGAFFVARAVIPVMRAQGKGVIVNTASVAGLRGGHGGAAYTVSKHGLIGLTRSIAATYGQFGIRCVAIAPGSIATGIPHGGEDSPLGRSVLDVSLQTRPGRGTAEDVAEVACFLASPAASMISGSVVVADKGWLAR